MSLLQEARGGGVVVNELPSELEVPKLKHLALKKRIFFPSFSLFFLPYNYPYPYILACYILFKSSTKLLPTGFTLFYKVNSKT